MRDELAGGGGFMTTLNSNGNLLGVHTHTHTRTLFSVYCLLRPVFIENYNWNLICNRCESSPKRIHPTIKQLPKLKRSTDSGFRALNSVTLWLPVDKRKILPCNCYKLPANSSWIEWDSCHSIQYSWKSFVLLLLLVQLQHLATSRHLNCITQHQHQPHHTAGHCTVVQEQHLIGLLCS